MRNAVALVLSCLSMVVFVSAGCARDDSDAVAAGTVSPSRDRSIREKASASPHAAEPARRALPTDSEPSWSILSEGGKALTPTAVAAAGHDLYFLARTAIWKVAGGVDLLGSPTALTASRLKPKGGQVGRVPVQEFCNFAFSLERHSLVVLDKSGDIVEMSVADGAWKPFRANYPMTGQPDPEFVDIAVAGAGKVYALDPERNQIWKFPAVPGNDRLFPEVMPWRLKAGDANVTDGLDIAFDGYAYVLKHNGNVTRYGDRTAQGPARSLQIRWRRPKDVRPSRLVTAPGTPLYVVERENNRVLAIDKKTGSCKQFIFSGSSDLRGLLAIADRFYVINGDRLVCRLLAEADPPSIQPNRRTIDPRLDGMILPVERARLPSHPGVWPGARRLYRYGVHKGVDFFHDPACKAKIIMGTPARAADGGKVIRADVNFRDMDAAKFNRVMQQCRVEHETSDKNEDLFRGCQVWIDHGNGLVTKYAHLNNVRSGLTEGSYVSRGDIIGGIGVSGTGQNLPGHAKHPHLHFEIWLDGKYLGAGLTPAETIGLFEDIFGTGCERGDS